jgi:hypothetical protein
VALIAIASLALGALGSLVGMRLPGTALAHEIGVRIICAVRLTEDCREEPRLRAANGAELAALLRAHAPALLYEEGMRALPVDFRVCRSDGCAEGPASGSVIRTNRGHRTVAFTHVIDCRSGRVAGTEAWGGNCSGSRAGNLYLQYWLYYPGSATAEGSTPLKGAIRRVSGAVGRSTHHVDDWEGWQVRIGPAGTFARATSHHGYNGWQPDGDRYYISGGSHAGRPLSAVTRSWIPLRIQPATSRSTKDARLILIPLETLSERERYTFAVSPPWSKRVYFDPEDGGTD